MKDFDILDFLPMLNATLKGGEYVADCPVCGVERSLKINKRSSRYATYHCECTKKIASHITKPPEKVRHQSTPRVTSEWIYCDRHNKPMIKVVRVDKKLPSFAGGGDFIERNFYQKHWNQTRWVNGFGDYKPSDIPIYRHREVREAIARGETIFIAEGEKCVDRLWGLKLAATCNIGGSLKWLPSHTKDLEGVKRVVLVSDKDLKGIKHISLIHESLKGYDIKVQWLYPDPNSIFWHPKYIPKDHGLDLIDWLDTTGTRDDLLRAIVDQPKDYTERFEQDKQDKKTDSQKLSIEDIQDALDQLIEQKLSGFTLTKELLRLSQSSGKYFAHIKELYQTRFAEVENGWKIDERAEAFKNLLEARAKTITLSDLFPSSLAHALSSKAESDRLDPIRLVQNLFPAIATILGGRVKIVSKNAINPKDRWVEYLIFFTADISPPSSGKSNASHAIWQPIEEMQAKEHNRFIEAEQQADKLEREWGLMTRMERANLVGSLSDPTVYRRENCIERKWLFDVAQMEAVLKRLSEQEPLHGTTWLADELSGLFKGLDQYKQGGKGDSQQILLEAWNRPIEKSIDRVDAKNSYQLGRQTLNLCGGIQPIVAKQIWKALTDPDGLLSRILPALSIIPKDFAVWSNTQVELNSTLRELYDAMQRIPQCEITMDQDVAIIWRYLWEELSRCYLNNIDDNPALAYFYGKQRSYLLRIAAILHAIDYCLGEADDLYHLSASALTRAWDLSDYYCAQFMLLQCQGGDTDDIPLEGKLLKIWGKCERLGMVDARQVVQAYSRSKFEGEKITTDVARNMLEAISKQGLGIFNGYTLYRDKNVAAQHDQET